MKTKADKLPTATNIKVTMHGDTIQLPTHNIFNGSDIDSKVTINYHIGETYHYVCGWCHHTGFNTTASNMCDKCNHAVYPKLI